MKTRLTLTLAVLLICTGAVRAAVAPPPPPPEEACANETGAAYGLCNAYCEAMDCDGEPEASATACTKVKDKYTQITGHGLPCEAVATCPCSEIPDWNTALADPVSGCFQLFGGGLQVTTTTNFSLRVTEAECSVTATFPPQAPNSLPVTPEESAVCLELLLPLCTPED